MSNADEQIIIEKCLLRGIIPFRNLTELSFKNINLFVGKNGSGKSSFLRCMFGKSFDSTMDQLNESFLNTLYNKADHIMIKKYENIINEYPLNSSPPDGSIELLFSNNEKIIFGSIDNTSNIDNHFVCEKTDLSVKNTLFSEFTTVSKKISNKDIFIHTAPFSKLDYDDELLKNINEKLSNLFQRKITIKSISDKGRIPYFLKGNNRIDPDFDGKGISTSFPLIEYLMFTKNMIVGIEEPTALLHPSIIPEYLKIIVELATKNNNQLFITTHDVVTAVHFFKAIYEQNPKFSIHKFEDNDGEVNVTEITKDNVTGSMDDFLGDFPLKPQRDVLEDLAGCFSINDT